MVLRENKHVLIDFFVGWYVFIYPFYHPVVLQLQQYIPFFFLLLLTCWFLADYLVRCSHCVRLAPTWEAFGRAMDDNPDIKIGKVS